MTVPRTVRGRSVLLLDQLRELLAAVESGAVPGAGPAYLHPVQGISATIGSGQAGDTPGAQPCTSPFSPLVLAALLVAVAASRVAPQTIA